MPTKRQILEELKQEELIAAVKRFDVPVADRRVKALLVEALASSPSAAAAEILAELKRDRLKELCRALGLDDAGREKAPLVSRLVEDARGSGPATGDVGASAAGEERRAVPAATPEREAERPEAAPPAPSPAFRPASSPGLRPASPPGFRPAAPRREALKRRAPREERPRRKQIDIQDPVLFESLKEDRLLAFALVTGQFIEGRIRRFDRYSVLVEAGGKLLLIYKSAISDISWPGQASRPSRY